MNSDVSLFDEIFDLILSGKITVFDLDFNFRTTMTEFYTAEFRRTRNFPDKFKETVKKVKADIDKLPNGDAKFDILQNCLSNEAYVNIPDSATRKKADK